MSDKTDRQSAYNEVTEMLENGVKEVFTSERYKEYLNFVSKFYNYSHNNTLLIMLQNPEASFVASYTDWNKKHNRHIKKGEKGIKIIAPSPYKVKVEVPVYDENKTPVVVDGKPLTEVKEIQKLGFKVVSVFDVSQTDGEPFIVPDFGNKELEADIDDYSALFEAISSTTAFDVKFDDIKGRAKGLCSYDAKTITINNGMSQAQNIKTLLHEIAHSRLHDPNKTFDRPSRDKREVQAESVAFVVANKLGLDTSDYSFDYIAGWSSNQEIKELKESLEIIQKEASAMIVGIQEKYQELIQSKEQNIAVDSSERAFENAISKGLKNPEKYMFMYSSNGQDHFKHIDTREYISFSQGNEKNIEQPIESTIEPPTQFYGMISYIGSTPMDTIPAFYDNFSDYSAELNYQKIHSENFGTILTKEQFIANISKSLASAGHSFNIGSSLKGVYVDEISDWIQKHPSEVVVPPALAEWSHKVTTVHQWENDNNIDESNRLTCKEEHTGQILTLHNDDKLLEARYAEILSSQEVTKSTTILSDTERPSYIRYSHSEQPKYSKEENARIVAQIKELPIQDYAQHLGFTVQQIGTYYTLKEHDSVRIDPSQNRFVRNSTGAKGSVIDFSMEFERLDKQSAISKLAGYIGAEKTLPSAHITQLNAPIKNKSDKLTLPQKADNMRNVFAYLINTRKIDPQIVSQWVHDKNLYQDTHKNCVFVTYDKNGNPEFASQRGTNTHKPFKADIIGSNYDTCHFINNNASKLVVGESMIDLMSVQTILQAKGRDLKGYNYLSLNGVTKTKAVLNALKNSPTDTVILATDNDIAGENARFELQKLISEYDKNIKAIEFVPQNEKDWNAELVANVLKEQNPNQDTQPSLSDTKTSCEKMSEAHNQNLEHKTEKDLKHNQDVNLD